MLAAFEEAGVEEGGNVVGLDRAEGDAARGQLDFHERLEPEHAARAVAHQADVEAARRGFFRRSLSMPKATENTLR